MFLRNLEVCFLNILGPVHTATNQFCTDQNVIRSSVNGIKSDTKTRTSFAIAKSSVDGRRIRITCDTDQQVIRSHVHGTLDLISLSIVLSAHL